MLAHRVLLISFLLLGVCLCSASTLDSGLFTTYTTDNAKTNLYWSVCGSVGGGTGCYSVGQLGPFGQIGSIIETAKVYDNREGTVTRELFVIDQAYGSGQTEVELYVYRRVDTIAGSSESTQFTFIKNITLPLTGGSEAKSMVAANKGFIVVGTSNSTVPVEVNRGTLAVTSLGIISQAPTSITADNYGYVTVTSAEGFFVIGPDGLLREDGGGSPFMINSLIGFQP